MHPFFMFVMSFFFFIAAGLVSLSAVYLLLKFSGRLIDAYIVNSMKKAIRENFHIGDDAADGNMSFSRKGITLSYHLTALSGSKDIKVISVRRKKRWYETAAGEAKRVFRDIFFYREWACLFYPPVFAGLLAGILGTYIVVFEPQAYKISRFNRVISGILGIPLEYVSYQRQGGIVRISGERKMIGGKSAEGVKFLVNPLKWVTFQDDGNIIRDMGKEGGKKDYPVIYNDNPNSFAIKKDGNWTEGSFRRDELIWKLPQEAGSSERKVISQGKIPLAQEIRVNDSKP